MTMYSNLGTPAPRGRHIWLRAQVKHIIAFLAGGPWTSRHAKPKLQHKISPAQVNTFRSLQSQLHVCVLLSDPAVWFDSLWCLRNGHEGVSLCHSTSYYRHLLYTTRSNQFMKTSYLWEWFLGTHQLYISSGFSGILQFCIDASMLCMLVLAQ